ncbi:MAG: YebC/PmpR family DNA-binding transcriptional regulator [Lentisphaerae bacterium]|nr:YebC/PmpR family DNA-binding transcriptional regulator [Lentisphaerota bacterium]
MSGHSKWATIKHKKGAADAKRGKAFSKIAKELMVEAKRGGSNPDMNAGLRALIQKAKSVNMPGDNIDRAIKKGAGELEGATFEEIVYEGYAGGGVGIVIKVLTDNRNRAAAEIRHILTKHGASLAGQGAVTRGFERKGQIYVGADKAKEESLMEIVLEAGAEDMQPDDDSFEILTDPASFLAVTEALDKAGIKPDSAEIAMIPTLQVPVTDKGTASSVMKLIGELEDNDDVQDVFTNMDLSDEILKQIENAG